MSAAFTILIWYAGNSHVAVVVYFTLAMGAMGGFYTGEAFVYFYCFATNLKHFSTGAQANFLDLCPNYSGALMGLVNGTGAVCGFLVPYLTGKITNNVCSDSLTLFLRIIHLI